MREKCYCWQCDRDVPANIDGTPKRHDCDGFYDLRPIHMGPELAEMAFRGWKLQHRIPVTVSPMGPRSPVADWRDQAWPDPGLGAGGYLKVMYVEEHHDLTIHRVRSRYQEGDRLWVRERIGACFMDARSILQINRIGVERAKDISYGDLLAEGFTDPGEYIRRFKDPLCWVWVIGFERVYPEVVL